MAGPVAYFTAQFQPLNLRQHKCLNRGDYPPSRHSLPPYPSLHRHALTTPQTAPAPPAETPAPAPEPPAPAQDQPASSGTSDGAQPAPAPETPAPAPDAEADTPDGAPAPEAPAQ